VVTLLGRNGAGKTTTMRAIMGMLADRKGSIAYEGREILHFKSNQIARLGIAYCPEERGIFASLNVRENLMLPPVVKDGGLGLDAIYELFPNLCQPGHQAVWRRAADAGDRTHPAHRRQDAPAR
jgi:branched-chain amino acid transport system ATP-binding protein